MAKAKELTGWHVLAMLLAFFALVAVANAIYITVALQSFPGVDEERSYSQGLRYNETLEERAAQSARGWAAEIVKAEIIDDIGHIEITFKLASGEPISGLEINGVIGRPVNAGYDFPVTFSDIGGGIYETEVAGIAPGQWQLKASARNTSDEKLDFETRLILAE